MTLIISGKFQHELDFIFNKFNLQKKDVYVVSNNKNTNLKIIYTMNDIVEKWYENGVDAEKYANDFCKKNNDKIIVIIQRGCGIVPIDEKLRKFRDYEGRVYTKMAENADEIYSVMCGIGIKIKG